VARTAIAAVTGRRSSRSPSPNPGSQAASPRNSRGSTEATPAASERTQDPEGEVVSKRSSARKTLQLPKSSASEVSREPSDSSPRAPPGSWKEFAGRSYGGDNYVPFDLARGLFALLRSRSGQPRSDSEDELGPVRMEDLIPATRHMKPCRQWDTKAKVTGRLLQTAPVDSFLGEGAYGLVWRAVHKTSKQPFAVKNIRPARKSQALAKREFEVCEKMNLYPHPFIVLLHEVCLFEDNGMYVLVMEYCPDGDLQKAVKAGRQHSPSGNGYVRSPWMPMWLGQVFLGLEHMHLQVGTLNRDLKPQNVVLNGNIAKLTDFGFSKICDNLEDLTQRGWTLSTRNYFQAGLWYVGRFVFLRGHGMGLPDWWHQEPRQPYASGWPNARTWGLRSAGRRLEASPELFVRSHGQSCQTT